MIDCSFRTAHLLFEQSGIFKRAFNDLGVSAFDYDFAGSPDFKVDLFLELEKSLSDLPSIFDRIGSDDLTIAFFPCIYFSDQSLVNFYFSANNLKNLSVLDRSEVVKSRFDSLFYFYSKFVDLITYFSLSGKSLIIENPDSQFLRSFSPIRPSIKIKNRSLYGDNFYKPTNFYCVNFEPYFNFIDVDSKSVKAVYDLPPSGVRGTCSLERSTFTPEFASNFIKAHLIGEPNCSLF